MKKNTLYAVFDMAVSPITFDILQFLQLCDLNRRAKGLEFVSVLFVLGPGRTFRNSTPKDKRIGWDDKIWRMRHIQTEAAWLLEACNGVHVFLDRDEAHRILSTVPGELVFPPSYRLERPNGAYLTRAVCQYSAAIGQSALVFKAPATALKNVDAWLEKRGISGPVVVLTLRNSRVEPERNARVNDWLRFAEYLKSSGQTPVIIPDTDEVLIEEFQETYAGCHVYFQGSLSLDLRAAMYQRSYMSMSDNGAGAFIHQWMEGSNCVIFQPPSKLPEVFRTSGEGGQGVERVLGIKRGEQFPFCTETQRLAWSEDVFDNIVAEYNTLQSLIANKGTGA